MSSSAAITDLVDQLLRDIRGSWRFRWVALAVAWLVCLIGWFIVFALPDVYQAQTRVFVDTSSRLRDVLGTIAFDPDVESRVLIVRQAMLGRPQLEKVAAVTGLFDQAPDEDAREKALFNLAENIEVAAGRSSTDRNLFRISYQHSDRQMSVAVVDALLNAFVEDVLQQRAQGAEAAQQFLRDQIDHYSEQLATAEERLAQFKRQNVGLMPNEGGDYFATMQTQLTTLQQLKSDLRVSESRRAELRRQLTGDTPFVDTAVPGSATTPGPTSDIDTRIAGLEATLGDLLLRYTDQHPEVRGLREQIDQLKQERTEAVRVLAEGGGDNSSLASSPVYQSVQIALNAADVEIAAQNARIVDTETKIADLRARLDTMPQVEAELARLNRDYDNTKALYDQLVAQLERERLVNEGDEREVVNFQIIDPPIAGIDPVAPPRAILLLAVLVLGFGAGAAVAYAMNMLKPVFLDSEQLRKVTSLPVLGSVSLVVDPQARMQRRVRTICYAGLVGCLVLCGGIVVVLNDVGTAFVQELLPSSQA